MLKPAELQGHVLTQCAGRDSNPQCFCVADLQSACFTNLHTDATYQAEGLGFEPRSPQANVFQIRFLMPSGSPPSVSFKRKTTGSNRNPQIHLASNQGHSLSVVHLPKRTAEESNPNPWIHPLSTRGCSLRTVHCPCTHRQRKAAGSNRNP